MAFRKHSKKSGRKGAPIEFVPAGAADVPPVPTPRVCAWNKGLEEFTDDELVCAFLHRLTVEGQHPCLAGTDLPGIASGSLKLTKDPRKSKGKPFEHWSIRLNSKYRMVFHITVDSVEVHCVVASDDSRRHR